MTDEKKLEMVRGSVKNWHWGMTEDHLCEQIGQEFGTVEIPASHYANFTDGYLAALRQLYPVIEYVEKLDWQGVTGSAAKEALRQAGLEE